MKRALSFAAIFLAVCFSVSAQGTATPIRPADLTLNQASPRDLVEGPVAVERTGSFRVLNNAWYGRGPLTLVDERLFSFPNAFGWVEGTPGDLLPTFSPIALPRLVPVGPLVLDTGSDSLGLVAKPDYVSGEVSVFYGKSIDGKSSREVKAGHILSEIVHGDTHISVGAFYEQSNGRQPLLIGH